MKQTKLQFIVQVLQSLNQCSCHGDQEREGQTDGQSDVGNGDSDEKRSKTKSWTKQQHRQMNPNPRKKRH